MGIYTGSKWGMSGSGQTGGSVTWSFAQSAGSLISFDAILGTPAFQQSIRLAFDLWESVANIDFVEIADQALSNIRLGWDSIDGAGSTLANAVWQYSGGQTLHSEVAFDLAETWTATAQSYGLDLFAVAVHEIGHTIGLGHTDDPSSIMYAYLQGGFAGLSAGDISAIQGLYGPSGTPAVAVSPTSLAIVGTAGSDTLSSAPFAGEVVTVTGGLAVADPNDMADQITLSGSGSGLAFGNGGGDDIVYRAAGAGSVYGGLEADHIEVINNAANFVSGGTQDGDVIIVTGNGSNVIFGGSSVADVTDGSDRITIFGNGANLIYANAGNDAVYIQGTGSDTVYGGLGDDVISAGAGADLLAAGPGANVLTGGAGADIFVYSSGARDIITDLNMAEGDRLALEGRAYTLTSAADGSAALVFADSGIIIMQGVTQDQFHGDLFV